MLKHNAVNVYMLWEMSIERCWRFDDIWFQWFIFMVSISCTTSALRELLFTLYLYSDLRPSVWGKFTSDN